MNSNCSQCIDAKQEIGNKTDYCNSSITLLGDDMNIWHFETGGSNQTIQFQTTEKYTRKECLAHGTLRTHPLLTQLDHLLLVQPILHVTSVVRI